MAQSQESGVNLSARDVIDKPMRNDFERKDWQSASVFQWWLRCSSRLNLKLMTLRGFRRSVAVSSAPVVYRDSELDALVSHSCGNVAYSDSRVRVTTHYPYIAPYIAHMWTVPKRLAYVNSIQLEMLRLVLGALRGWITFTGGAVKERFM